HYSLQSSPDEQCERLGDHGRFALTFDLDGVPRRYEHAPTTFVVRRQQCHPIANTSAGFDRCNEARLPNPVVDGLSHAGWYEPDRVLELREQCEDQKSVRDG